MGVGFFINWGGLRQASVAWPDAPAARYTEDQFELGTVELIGADETPVVEPEASQDAGDVETPVETPVVEPEPEKDPAGNTKSEAQHIRDYITANPEATNAQVIEHLATVSVEVTSSQVAYQRKRLSKNG